MLPRRRPIAAAALALLGLFTTIGPVEVRGAGRFRRRHGADPPEVTVGERLFLETRLRSLNEDYL